MKRSFYIFLISMLVTTFALAAGRITNTDVKSLNDIKTSVLTTTGTLTSSSACIASPVSIAGVKSGLYVYDASNPSFLATGTKVAGVPGSCSAGQIQLTAASSGSGTDTITFGGQLSQLINDTKIYVTNSNVLEQLSASIADGSLFEASSVLTTKGDTLGYSTTTARVGVGADGTVYTADSTQATGVKWASPAGLPAGIILPFGGSTAPPGFLMADGSAVSRVTYSNLFTNIGTNFGSGDGSTTFNLPDLRWSVPRGYGIAAPISGSGTPSSNNATFTSHGFTHTGIEVRLISGTLTGLTTSTDYWVIVIDPNTLAFATSRANAIAGTKITLSGTNSGVVRQAMDPDESSRVALAPGGNSGAAVGTYQDDAIQGHYHSLSNGTGGSLFGNPNGYQNNQTTGTGDALSSPGNGTVRTSAETRSKNVYVNYIISF